MGGGLATSPYCGPLSLTAATAAINFFGRHTFSHFWSRGEKKRAAAVAWKFSPRPHTSHWLEAATALPHQRTPCLFLDISYTSIVGTSTNKFLGNVCMHV